jgi:hypothetical protein
MADLLRRALVGDRYTTQVYALDWSTGTARLLRQTLTEAAPTGLNAVLMTGGVLLITDGWDGGHYRNTRFEVVP